MSLRHQRLPQRRLLWSFWRHHPLHRPRVCSIRSPPAAPPPSTQAAEGSDTVFLIVLIAAASAAGVLVVVLVRFRSAARRRGKAAEEEAQLPSASTASGGGPQLGEHRPSESKLKRSLSQMCHGEGKLRRSLTEMYVPQILQCVRDDGAARDNGAGRRGRRGNADARRSHLERMTEIDAEEGRACAIESTQVRGGRRANRQASM